MADVPKIVRERLKASSTPLPHPDADVLTAYSERCLPKRERTAVLDHLSSCAECREIVALALPATEPVQALPPRSRSWLAWPAFRWGFASAGLALIAIFVALQYRHQGQPTMTLKTAPPAMEAKTEPTQALSTSQNKATATEEKANPDVSKDLAVTRAQHLIVADKHSETTASANQPATVEGFVISRDKLAHGPMQSNQWQQQNAFAKQVPTVSLPAPNQSAAASAGAPATLPVAVQSQSPVIDTGAAQNSNLAINNQSLSDLQQQGGQAESEVEKAKPAMLGPSKTVVDSDRLAFELRPTRALAGITPRWTINSSGGLQRSYDQGVTWQDVSVTKPTPSAAVQLYAAPERAKVAKAPLPAKKDLAPPVFRNVVANGADVWAGGANGVLYHSTDAGANWAPVVPASSDIVLTGDILTMEFPDPQHGKIVTSTSETWTTSDRGLTWQKQ